MTSQEHRMDTIISHFDPTTLEPVLNANLAQFLATVMTHLPGAEVHHGSDLLWCITDTNFWLFNSLVPLRLAKEDMETAVAAARDRAVSRQVESIWWVSPSALDDGFGPILEANGFVGGGGPPAMAIDLTTLQSDQTLPEGFEIKQVLTEAMLEQWIDVMMNGYPLPDLCRQPMHVAFRNYGLGSDFNMRHYLGYFDGRPVTCSTLVLADGVAGIYDVATLPEARGRGLGGHVTRQPLDQAKAEGYRVGMLQSSSMGHNVYLRIGFEDVFQYQMYLWSPTKQD
jgi:GNAT superfamily N-acetyltransferase